MTSCMGLSSWLELCVEVVLSVEAAASLGSDDSSAAAERSSGGSLSAGRSRSAGEQAASTTLATRRTRGRRFIRRSPEVDFRQQSARLQGERATGSSAARSRKDLQA